MSTHNIYFVKKEETYQDVLVDKSTLFRAMKMYVY